MIGSAIAGITWICKRFPTVYNKNILLLSGLSHKFKAYRISLFSVTLLVGFAVFFIGIGMSFYIYGEMTIDSFQPYDFMVERRSGINDVNEDELHEIVNGAGGKIETIKTLPYLDGLVYRELNERNGLFVNFRQNSYLVSESDYNRFMGENIDLASSCIVLYYKIAADTDEETENISTFKKIGLTIQECRSYLQTHTAIIFFLPLMLGGVLGLYLTYQFFSTGTSHAGYLITRVAMMYGGIVVFGILLFGTLRKRFFKDVKV